MGHVFRDKSPYTFPGVSDGGAHMKFFNGGAFTTDFLVWLVRDTEQITLEEAHYRLSALPAHAAGFRDRGVLREGAANGEWPAPFALAHKGILGMFNYTYLWFQEGGHYSSDQVADAFLDILLNGLLNSKGKSQPTSALKR